MGVDLTLLPYHPRHPFSHIILPLERRSSFWGLIETLPTEPVPPYFGTYLCCDGAYEEWHYGNTQETPYGEPLMATTVSALLTLQDSVPEDELTMAAWKYLNALPADWRVALYWH